MKKINKTKYAILGMLFEKPRSGYEIKRFMLESTNHFWQESDASIYPMLKTLQAQGLVTSRSEFVGKRERQIFEITPTGKKEFSAWLALPAAGETHRSELLLKLFFGANATKKDTLNQLLLHQKKVKALQEQFKNIEENVLPQIPDSYPHKIYWEMALENGILTIDAELKWIKKCIQKLEIKELEIKNPETK